jgi:hypothetical protein
MYFLQLEIIDSICIIRVESFFAMTAMVFKTHLKYASVISSNGKDYPAVYV